ncbi:MAG: T9SS type A sorting domain-containing protein [Bacteroidota bacterium]
MKRFYVLCLFAICCSFQTFTYGQAMIFEDQVFEVNEDFRGDPVVVGQIDFNAPAAGKVWVRFDGMAIVDVGDRLIIAASNEPDWSPNDGNIGLEAYNSDNNRRTFSHSRSYDVTAGPQTFYAVAENFIETSGDGEASIYGRLIVKYYPNQGLDTKFMSDGINETGVDFRGADVVVSQMTITAPTDGYVTAHFDGSCVSDPGDRIMLAVNDMPVWEVNDGHVSVESFDNDLNQNPFSHTQSYLVGPGNHTFYAVGENWVEQDGDGEASVYGHFTLEFTPIATGEVLTLSESVNETNVDFRGADVVLADIEFNPPTSGKVLVSFDGMAIVDVGDRIMFAANDDPVWEVNNGHVSVEVPDFDISRMSFSHSRVFDVAPGFQNFYAVGENWVEQDGDGEASVYGRFTLQFFPDLSTSIEDPAIVALFESLQIAPNPSDGYFELRFQGTLERTLNLEVYDNQGRVIRQAQLAAGTNPNLSLDLRTEAAGIYYVSLIDGAGRMTTTISIQR